MKHLERIVHRADRALFLEAFRLRLLRLDPPEVREDEAPAGKPCVLVDAAGQKKYVFATHNVRVEANLETGRVVLDGPEFALPYELFLDGPTTSRAHRPRALGRSLFLSATKAA